MTMHNCWAQNGPSAPKKIFFFFLENHYYQSHLPIIPFRCAKLLKNSLADQEL